LLHLTGGISNSDFIDLNEPINEVVMKRGSYDSKFKAMAVEMAYVKSFVNETRSRPKISNSLLGKWRKLLKQGEPIERDGTTLKEE